MQNTPVFGWPYPENGDHTRTWEYWQGLALAVEATLNKIANPAFVCVEQSVIQSIPNNAYTALNFDVETVDTANMHSTSTNPQRLTCTLAGMYQLVGGVYFASNTTGRRGMAWYVNGTQTKQSPVVAAAVIGAAVGVAAPTILVRMNLNDYVELRAFQDSGAALDTGASANTRSWAMARYLGP